MMGSLWLLLSGLLFHSQRVGEMYPTQKKIHFANVVWLNGITQSIVSLQQWTLVPVAYSQLPFRRWVGQSI